MTKIRVNLDDADRVRREERKNVERLMRQLGYSRKRAEQEVKEAKKRELNRNEDWA